MKELGPAADSVRLCRPALRSPMNRIAGQPAAARGQVMCPVCGTLLGLSHSRPPNANASSSATDRGARPTRRSLVAEYGGQVLALPENRGIDVWPYAVPVIGLVLGLIGVIAAIVVWRRRPQTAGTRTEAALSRRDDRLDEDMARFDL